MIDVPLAPDREGLLLLLCGRRRLNNLLIASSPTPPPPPNPNHNRLRLLTIDSHAPVHLYLLYVPTRPRNKSPFKSSRVLQLYARLFDRVAPSLDINVLPRAAL